MTITPSPDLTFGAFTDNGPWVLNLEQLGWRRGADGLAAVRRRTKDEVPVLMR
jgi:hypothetical protein